MRIVYIAAGAGGMYCGACARDIALVRALTARGHDVEVVPLYTPLRRDGGDPLPTAPVFYGGINVYLQQLSPLFRRTPMALARALDNPALLNWVSRYAISTDPAKLGAMTVSVLAGREGKQQAEQRKLLDHLAAGEPPEIVVITNSLLSSIAPEVKVRLGVPVVCLLQGEEEFINAMGAPYREQAISLIRAHAASVDLFVASYEAYVTEMRALLNVPYECVALIRAGIDTPVTQPVARPREPFTIGYLSVITPGKGLDLLVAAVAQLAREGRDVRLLIAGKAQTPGFWRELQPRFAALSGRVEVLGEIDYVAKQAFWRRCSAFVLPSRFREARGMVVLEAQYAGVPVVVPEAGVFPEMLALTGGGLLVPQHDAGALARALARLQDDPAEADRLGRAGTEGVARHYAAAGIAGEVQAIFARLIAHRGAQIMAEGLPSNE